MKIRAPFRYWGSKVRMAPWIVERLPEHDHFVEGCAGSASVMAVKPPVAAETLNDTYREVTNFFRVLQDRACLAELVDLVAATPYSLIEFREAGLILEDALTPSPDLADEPNVWRAWAFFVRMQMAVVPGRSGWSYGAGGASAKKANKPGRWATMPELLRLCAERFERVQVTDWDIVDLIGRLDKPGVLIFMDPPYTEQSRASSTGTSSGYVEDSFDHGAFLEAVHGAKHARFAITHYPDPLYDDQGFVVLGDYSSHRNVPNGEGRDVKIERLYLGGAL